MNRVPLVATCWLGLWTLIGFALGRYLDVPGTFTVGGFLLGVVSVFSWPFVLPDRLQDWMDG